MKELTVKNQENGSLHHEESQHGDSFLVSEPAQHSDQGECHEEAHPGGEIRPVDSDFQLTEGQDFSCPAKVSLDETAPLLENAQLHIVSCVESQEMYDRQNNFVEIYSLAKSM